MKAVVLSKYGPPEVLQLREIDRPVPKDNEVLIRVHATTVTAGDCEMRRFKIMPLFWLPLRIYMGIFRPRDIILGQELAGEIEATGKDVTGFQVGDQVVAATGIRLSAHAEYICLPEDGPVVIKPANMSYEEAAAIPVGGLNALHFLRRANIKPGERVLIYGTSGSIGTMAVQLAKHFGAQVTGVCSTDKIELVKSLVADTVIDYTKEDFTENGETYDVIFETVGKSSFSRGIESLAPDGRYLLANPKVSEMVRGFWISKRSSKRVIFEFAGYPIEDFIYLKELIEAGEITTVIDRSYPLEQMVEAHRYVEQGHKRGNVIITANHGDAIEQGVAQ